jgi:predicted choloylglycine hydrolase
MIDSVKCFRAIDERFPDEKWLAYYGVALPGYRHAFNTESRLTRPTLIECREALSVYMPELLPLWEHLLTVTYANIDDARLLSFYGLDPCLAGCSQAVWTRNTPILVRNYDCHPGFCEGRVMKTCWHGTQVIASTDCLWGVLDGMNEHGLCVSFALGEKDASTRGFSIPIILRYVLEFCATVDEAVRILCRVPAHAACNITVLDASGQMRTVELTPGFEPTVTATPLAVNHQGEFSLAADALFSRVYERRQCLSTKLHDPLSSIESFANAFEYSPLFVSDRTRGFGTLYTAIYNPQLRAMEYRWPNQLRMYQSFAFFEECDVWARYQ